jgi:hypothetical protein
MTSPLEPTGPLVAIVVPITQLGEGQRPVVRRHNGRPRRVESAPTIDEDAYLAAVAIAAEAAEARDNVVVAAGASTSLAVIDAAMAAVAVEASALLWERERAQRAGKPEAARISARRTSALMHLADMAIARAQLAAASLEPDPADVERVVALLVEAVEKVIGEVADPDMGARFVAHLTESMEAADFPACCTRRLAGPGPDHQR